MSPVRSTSSSSSLALPMGGRTAVLSPPRAAVPVVLALVLAGCSSAGSGSGPASGSVSIQLTEYKMTPATITLDAGSFTFTATNAGTISHALELSGNGVDAHTPDFAFAPGHKEGFTVTLKPGTYQYFCPVDGHRGLGMQGTLVV